MFHRPSRWLPKWWSVRIMLVAVLIALPVYIVPVVSQSTLETEETIWHDVWNRIDHVVMGVGWTGPSAADVIETPRTILNDVWDRLTHSLRISGGGGGGGGSSTYGVISAPSTGVDSIHYNSVTLTNTCGLLGSISHVNVAAGPSGSTCILPDPSLLTTPGYYSIVVTDANRLTLAPSGSTLLNGSNAPLPSVLGPRGLFIVERRSDTEWLAQVISSVGFGEPFTSVCTSTGGSTNTSSSGSGTWVAHTLNCPIPAAKITTGTIIDACVMTRLVSGSAPPTLTVRFVANSTVIWQGASAGVIVANVPGYTGKHCISIMGGGVPSATASLYTAAILDVTDSQYGNLSSIIGDPVLVDTLPIVTLAFESQWTTAGTGTSSLQEMAFDVRGARFAN